MWAQSNGHGTQILGAGACLSGVRQAAVEGSPPGGEESSVDPPSQDDVATVHCRFCHAPLTRRGGIHRTSHLSPCAEPPDHHSMTVFIGRNRVAQSEQILGPEASLELAEGGCCLVGERTITLHPNDLLGGALRSVDSFGEPGSCMGVGEADISEAAAVEVQCSRCEMTLGFCVEEKTPGNEDSGGRNDFDDEPGAPLAVVLLRHRVLARSVAFNRSKAIIGSPSAYERFSRKSRGRRARRAAAQDVTAETSIPAATELESDPEMNSVGHGGGAGASGGARWLFSDFGARQALLSQILSAARLQGCLQTAVEPRGRPPGYGYVRLELVRGPCRVEMAAQEFSGRGAQLSFVWEKGKYCDLDAHADAAAACAARSIANPEKDRSKAVKTGSIDSQEPQEPETDSGTDTGEVVLLESRGGSLEGAVTIRDSSDSSGSGVGGGELQAKDDARWQLCRVLPSEFESIVACLTLSSDLMCENNGAAAVFKEGHRMCYLY